MSGQVISNPEVEELLKQESNKKCFDCGYNNPHWASITNGVFICINCAGKHRSWGTHISVVKSATMDNISDSHANLLKNGGNLKLKQYLKKQKIDPNKLSLKQKYNNKAMVIYREYLKNNKDINDITYIGFQETIHKKNNSQSIGFGNPNNDALMLKRINNDRERFRCCPIFTLIT
mmetsp:Transcript_95110/g.116448  ORF Transcript_95110/g.116448 Transcript_95110/m.116448 type:complete len:176 (+) Transcript_95110:75-602(+)